MYFISGAILRRTAYPLTGGSRNYFLTTPNCTGGEQNLFSCPYSILHSGVSCGYEAGVLCQGKLSLYFSAWVYQTYCQAQVSIALLTPAQWTTNKSILVAISLYAQVNIANFFIL